MNTCPADAPNAGKPSAEQQSALGTEPAPSSGLDGLTLFERLILQRLDALINQQYQMIELYLGEPEPGDDDEPPTHYLNGQRVS